ncbi:MAG TPA: ABC transporter ATP-binding protein [Chitinispirillaceae bacterium]|nr:ABC transporter ATP-binding protein [Chitinispirillaceae bacterium]
MHLDIKNLSASFHLRGSKVNAVRGVSLSIADGKTVGIVGESGSGKTVLSLSFLRLLPTPPAVVKGNAFFGNLDLINCSDREIRSIRGNRISMIFQDPLSSFNPYLRLSQQLTEPLLCHQNISRKQALEISISMLSETGICDPHKKITCYPHQFSGGMLQRAMIAMALVTKPDMLIADEPTTALDVTTQAQILSLMKKLQQQYSMSIIFITHNLGIVAGFCDFVHVMYAGMILESAQTRLLFKNTAHPYTKALIRSVPSLHSSVEQLYVIGGPPYDPSQPLKGCPFAPRCEFCVPECFNEQIELTEIEPEHKTTCIRVKQGELCL